MKISVEEKMKEAEQMSLHHPDIFYMVMDKIGKRAIVTGDFCVYRERISDGYFTVATFILNGDPETYLKTVTEYKPWDR